MVDSKKFIGTEGDYTAVVNNRGWCWTWVILKDAVIIDDCVYHPHIPRQELQAKVGAERAINKLLITK